MRKLIAMAVFTVASLGLMEGTAQAWHVRGTIYCDVNLNGVIDSGDLPLSGLTVTVTGGGFTGSDTTGNYGSGAWAVFLPDTPATYTIAVTGNSAPIISPTSLTFSTTAANNAITIDILIDGQGCQQVACWLTAGGVKFNPITNAREAELDKGPAHTWGGNVNPGCSPTAGEGGQFQRRRRPDGDPVAGRGQVPAQAAGPGLGPAQGRRVAVDELRDVHGGPSPVRPLSYYDGRPPPRSHRQQ